MQSYLNLFSVFLFISQSSSTVKLSLLRVNRYGDKDLFCFFIAQQWLSIRWRLVYCCCCPSSKIRAFTCLPAAINLERLSVAVCRFQKAKKGKTACCVQSACLVIYSFPCCYVPYSFRARAGLRTRTHRHPNPSRCPQKNGSRNGSKVRQTTWEWTHLTISRESLILFSNKEGLARDIFKRALAFYLLPRKYCQKNQIAVFLPTFISTINEPSPSFHQHYQLHTPKTAQFKWGEVMWNFMSGFNSLCKIIIIQFTLTLIYVLLQCEKRFITEVCLFKGEY